MCRMLAYVSAGRAEGLEELLCGGPKSLLAQAVADKTRLQADGWGVASWRGPRPLLVKSPGAVAGESARFAKAAAAASASGMVIAHLRQASNPSNLPKSRLISAVNTQPFSKNSFVFAHNGTLFIHGAVRKFLGKYAGQVKGTNDSEVLFHQVLKMLDAYGSMPKALSMAADEIRTIWYSCLGEYKDRKAPYRGLNMFLSDGKTLAVMCGPQVKDDKGALLTRGWEYGRIAFRRAGNSVIFSSEPADGGRWEKMPGNSVAVVGRSGGKLDFKLLALKGN